MRIQGYGLSDVGQERGNNEDSLLIDDALGLYIVADGMGGHAHGEVASSAAVRTVARYLREEGIASKPDLPIPELVAVAETAVQHASKRIWEMATSRQGYAGMGTTLSILLVRDTKGIMLHVGDSRLYLMRGDRIDQLSSDHTFTSELVRNGVFTPEQVRNSPYSNVLTRALGKSETVQVDTLVFDILPGDTFLICSDGLTGYVPDDELGDYLCADDIRGLPHQLVALANERGGHDNITAVVVRSDDGDAVSQEELLHCTRIQEQFSTLQAIHLFKGISMAGLVKLMDISRELPLTPGQSPINEGDVCPGLLIILEGSVAVIRDGYQLATLGPGDMAGEMSCLRQTPSTATLKALTPCRYMVIDYSELERLYSKDPTLGINLLRNLGHTLAERLDKTTSRLLSDRAEQEELDELPSILFVP